VYGICGEVFKATNSYSRGSGFNSLHASPMLIKIQGGQKCPHLCLVVGGVCGELVPFEAWISV
jgi:hypothetical protein